MSFTAITFVVFFPIISLLYFIIPKVCRNPYLLVVSYLFYMGWKAKYGLLLFAVTIIAYILGLLLEKTINPLVKKGIVLLGVMAAVCVLIFYKYLGFLISNMDYIFAKMGFHFNSPVLEIVLPVGISFYTFQALGYVIDVYRGKIDAEKNLIEFALFVAFFPQLVAGPIERSGNMLHQIHNSKNICLWNYKRVVDGFITMLWGYFMKLVIADRAAVYVNQVYGQYNRYGSIEIMTASMLFAIQIYCDFGGYSMIALGVARIMGFDLMENFRAPYFAKSVKDFWNRWHISLTSWFRDYIYIPLGGNRKGRIRTYVNLFLVFLLSGLWHGAAWHFIIWGGINGVYLILERIYGNSKIKQYIALKDEMNNTFGKRLGDRICTFMLIDISWLFFRADSVKMALVSLKRIFFNWNPWVLFDGSLYNLGLNVSQIHILIVGIILLFLVDYLRSEKNITLSGFLFCQPIVFRYVFLISLLLFIVYFGWYGSAFDAGQFIYFQF